MNKSQRPVRASMVTGPERYCQHLTADRYHPRSSKHGDFMAQAFLADLLEVSEALRRAAAEGRLAYSLNFDIIVAEARVQETLSPDALKGLAWNIDLALGPPVKDAPPRLIPRLLPPDVIREAPLADVWLMLDAKGVMTEHGKARRNRQRDLTALWAVMHTFYPDSVVGAVIPVNISPTFNSPLRAGGTDHRNIVGIVNETLAIFRSVKRREERADTGVEGVGCFVVDFTNFDGDEARLVLDPPAPQGDDPIRYENFVSRMARHLEERFQGRL